MTADVRRIIAVVALASALACSRGGSGGNAGSSGSAGGEGVRSVEGVVAAVTQDAVQVKTEDGRVLDFPMRDDTKVTLAGGEASTAVVTEGAPVRVSFREKAKGNEVVTIDVEPKARAGSAAGQPPAAGPLDANAGNQGDAQGKAPRESGGAR
ncbi:MAG TPA: hypothetical protein VFL83_18255 [Anaeromyxobacter sp.]|nr:hypothetical protein [Anaeromyxobacter sp.]